MLLALYWHYRNRAAKISTLIHADKQALALAVQREQELLDAMEAEKQIFGGSGDSNKLMDSISGTGIIKVYFGNLPQKLVDLGKELEELEKELSDVEGVIMLY